MPKTCPNCGGSVRLVPDSRVEHLKGLALMIPVEVPTCEQCDEQFISPQVADEMQTALENAHQPGPLPRIRVGDGTAERKEMNSECQGKEVIAKILIDRAERNSSHPIQPDENFHQGCGCTVTRLTKDDIAKLLAGEPLWFDDGEYSHIIIAEKQDE